MKHVDHTGGHWPALVEFFDKDWWRRVWVRQELIVSRDAVVLFGSTSVAWTDVAAVSHWLKVWTPDLDARTRKNGARHRSGVYAGEDLEGFRQASKTKGKLDFQTMLIHARNCEATNPCDKVFAILGLIEEDVDYDLPESEIAKQTFKKLVSTNNLGALIFSQCEPGK